MRQKGTGVSHKSQFCFKPRSPCPGYQPLISLPLYLLIVPSLHVTWVLYFANDKSVIGWQSNFPGIHIPCNTGAFASYFRDSPQRYQPTPGLCRRWPGRSRGLPGHTLAPPAQHRECIVTNRSITGQTVVNFGPKPGLVRSVVKNIWTHSNFFINRPGSSQYAGCKRPGRTGADTGTVWTRLYVFLYKSVYAKKHAPMLLCSARAFEWARWCRISKTQYKQYRNIPTDTFK